MLDNNIDIIERIKNQNEELIKWDKELKKELSEKPKNSVRKIKLFLIKTDWLNNYAQTFFKGEKDDNKLIHSYQNFNLINNSYFFKLTSFKELPKVYPLNEICWLYIVRNKYIEKELMFEGKFYNKIFLSQIIIINNCNVYCFFFLNDKNQINQGYIKINQKDKENEIINNLKNNGPLQFINNCRNNNSNNPNIINEWSNLKYFELFFPTYQMNKINNNYSNFNNDKNITILNTNNRHIDHDKIKINNYLDKF